MLMASPDRDILGISVKTLDFGTTLADLTLGLGAGKSQRKVNFLNANNANIAQNDQAYREALARSDVLPDGIGVDIAAKMLAGAKFPANLNGTDLVPAFFVFVSRPLKIALVGAKPDVLQKALVNFQALTPWHEFKAISDGYFDATEAPRVLADLAAFKPDVTLVAMGSPAQEKWIDAQFGPEHGKIVFGVGALFDFVSGTVPRAPRFFRELRLEWVYRLAKEPGRLWRRYIVGNPVFLYRVLRYKFSSNPMRTRTVG